MECEYLSIGAILIIQYRRTMEKYKIEELIGAGSFGSVYRVRNDQGQVFAYKRIKVDPFQVEETQQEIDIMRKLKHPNLIKIYEHHFDQKEDELRIIMQYCEGGDLSQFIKTNKNIPPKTILSILQQIVSAFIVMSAKGVMHRDLKPENILLTKDNMVIKIADFGCAKEVGINNLSALDSRSIEKGTYLYISPQQLKMEKYSFKCDVWAAGCIAYLLQYGYHPFIEADPHNVLIQITKKAMEQPIEVLSETDPSIAAFIHLTLLYDDIQRASWRQLQLGRIFTPKITNVDKYINYLKTLSPLANTIVKEFWKIHKSFKFPNYLDEVLIYYLIKFQMNNLKMCLRLFKKMESYGYLFDKDTYDKYQPKEEAFNEVKKSYLEYERYFTTVKKTIQAKECYSKFIAPYEPKRVSSFTDLDKSIWTGYKILRWVKQQLKEHPLRQSRSWVLLAKWINFERWFSFQKQFNLQKVSTEPTGDVLQQINEALARFERGSSE